MKGKKSGKKANGNGNCEDVVRKMCDNPTPQRLHKLFSDAHIAVRDGNRLNTQSLHADVRRYMRAVESRASGDPVDLRIPEYVREYYERRKATHAEEFSSRKDRRRGMVRPRYGRMPQMAYA